MYYGIDNPHGGDTYHKKIKLDFSANVNPFGTPDSIIEAAKEALNDTFSYPDPYCRDLINALSGYLQIPKEMIYAGSGASELIYAYCLASSFRKAAVVSPTFLEYETALKTAGTEVIPYITGKEEGFVPDEALIGFIHEVKPDAVFLCNPNNPTGRTLDREFLIRVLEAAEEERASLFIDECFCALSEKKVTLKDQLSGHPGLFILRAFTKSFALASLRLGYCLCSNEEVFRKMSAVTPPWSVSGPAQAAGIAALSELDFLRDSAEKLKAERAWFADEIAKTGFRVWPGEVNYIFISAREDLQDRLREKGIEIRSCANYTGLEPGYFRIAVRRHEENRQLIQAIRELNAE